MDNRDIEEVICGRIETLLAEVKAKKGFDATGATRAIEELCVALPHSRMQRFVSAKRLMSFVSSVHEESLRNLLTDTAARLGRPRYE